MMAKKAVAKNNAVECSYEDNDFMLTLLFESDAARKAFQKKKKLDPKKRYFEQHEIDAAFGDKK
jgi:hypothetical protein